MGIGDIILNVHVDKDGKVDVLIVEGKAVDRGDGGMIIKGGE